MSESQLVGKLNTVNVKRLNWREDVILVHYARLHLLFLHFIRLAFIFLFIAFYGNFEVLSMFFFKIIYSKDELITIKVKDRKSCWG